MPRFYDIWGVSFERMKSFSEEELWLHYEDCLIAHDWTYQMTEDPSIFQTGVNQEKHIAHVKKLCEAFDEDKAERLFNKHGFFPFEEKDDGF